MEMIRKLSQGFLFPAVSSVGYTPHGGKLDDRLAVNDRSEQRKEIVEESSIIAEQLFADLESYDEVDETPLPVTS